MTQPGEKPVRKLRLSFAVILLCLILIPVLTYILLFRVNRFSLEIRPLEGEHTVISSGEDFLDPGAEVYLVGSFIARRGFLIDAELTAAHNVDVDKPGDYPLTYTARWKGLQSISSRLVTVRDVTAPTITLHSDPGHYTLMGQDYQEEGYSAWDDCDGDLTDFVSRISDGEYVTYVVTDQAGNCTSVTRKIVYQDPFAPEIELLGGNTVRVKAGEGFTEPGWSAIDNVDGDISHWVKMEGQVDKYLAGTYELTYSVADNSGNEVQAVRTVIVEPVGIQKTVTPENRVIYLTFDDGPGPYTQYLLDVLARYDAKATFFVVDSEYNELFREILDAGHAIGIHSVKHEYRSIYESPEAFFQDLLSMQKIIYEETGEMTYLMRFPGGSSNTVSRFNEGIMTYLTQAVEDCGFRYFDWNVDSDDAGRAKTAEEVYENVIAGVENVWIPLVLQHDIKPYSVEAVEKILQWGRKHGYRFEALDMTSPMAHHGVNN